MRALTSWRTASVTLLSFASGLPLGLVWIAIPDWMRSIGIDIRVVGLITLAQAPWTFKFLWAPLMDRYVPPFLGRRRGWTVIAQVGLFASTLALAGVGGHPETAWVVGALALAVAFASSTQDIAIDAYAVDVLRPEEQGIAVGARIAIYRAAMFVAGGLAITLAASISWPGVMIGLAVLYLPMLLISIFAPEPEETIPAPKRLKDAVWYPFLGFLARHRALEILAFVFLYKFADNLAGSLLRPFLVDMGYDEFHRGVALATVALFGTIGGTLLGGICTTTMGLGHSLWFFGALQIFSNLGYVLVAGRAEPNVPLMYAAIGFEQVTSGMGTGAFSVLLLRLTQKRFSATQYALFSSLFSLPRVFAGPISGFFVYAMGWKAFFWFTIAAGVPGMLLLYRFVPFGQRELGSAERATVARVSMSSGGIVAGAALGGVLGVVIAAGTTVLLAALRGLRAKPENGFDLATPFSVLVGPGTLTEWVTLVGVLIFGAVVALMTAAVLAVRSGVASVPDEEAPPEDAAEAAAPPVPRSS